MDANEAPASRDEWRIRRHLAAESVVGIDGLLFTSPHGAPIRYSNWRRGVWTQIIEAAGVEVPLHDLRRSAATRLIVEDRWSPAELQTFLGRCDPRVTLAIYTKVSENRLPVPSSLGVSR